MKFNDIFKKVQYHMRLMSFSIIKNPYFFILWLTLILISYFFIDKPLAMALYPYDTTQSLVYKIGKIISLVGLGAPYIIGFALLWMLAFFVLKNRYWIFCASLLFLSATIPGLICNILKSCLGRSRPELLFNQDLYGFYFFQFNPSGDYYSFPSGHATTIAGVMTACFLIGRRLPWILITITALVMISRLIISAHFLSDVMAGAYLGCITTYWIYVYLNKQTYFINQ